MLLPSNSKTAAFRELAIERNHIELEDLALPVLSNVHGHHVGQKNGYYRMTELETLRTNESCRLYRWVTDNNQKSNVVMLGSFRTFKTSVK